MLLPTNRIAGAERKPGKYIRHMHTGVIRSSCGKTFKGGIRMKYDRNYKSSIFAMLYEKKENIMDLYNGIYDEKCTDPEEITVNTLTDEDGVESGIFARFRNDLSFIFGAYLNLFEHQSTINNNIPVRMLIYVVELITKLIPKEHLYREKAVKIPSPRFVVFYNGSKEAPLKKEIRLSDQYISEQADADLELKVVVYNINTDNGSELLKKSRTLGEYMIFVDRARTALKETKDELQKKRALERVIDECIAEGIMSELLEERREEIIVTSILNYDQAAHEQALHDDGFEAGTENTLLNNVRSLMKTMKMTVDEAMDALQITGTERDYIAKAMRG